MTAAVASRLFVCGVVTGCMSRCGSADHNIYLERKKIFPYALDLALSLRFI